MRQSACNVIEAESFLKKHFEALPVGMGELPTTALPEPTHIICTSLISTIKNNLPHPCNIPVQTQTHRCGVHMSLEEHTYNTVLYIHTHSDTPVVKLVSHTYTHTLTNTPLYDCWCDVRQA